MDLLKRFKAQAMKVASTAPIDAPDFHESPTSREQLDG